MSLRRLVINFGREGVEVCVLYRRASPGPNPQTKARAREVTELAKAGLTEALGTLEGSEAVEMIGTSGFETREDTISAENLESAQVLGHATSEGEK